MEKAAENSLNYVKTTDRCAPFVMNSLQRLCSKIAFGAIALYIVSSCAAFAQVNYYVSGILSLVSGPDPLGLTGRQFTATATMSQSTTPSMTATTTTSSTNTYSGVTVSLNLPVFGSENCAGSITLTDNVGSADVLSMSCPIFEHTVTASLAIPDDWSNRATGRTKFPIRSAICVPSAFPIGAYWCIPNRYLSQRKNLLIPPPTQGTSQLWSGDCQQQSLLQRFIKAAESAFTHSHLVPEHNAPVAASPDRRLPSHPGSSPLRCPMRDGTQCATVWHRR